jgi:hypothetical protein
MSPQRDITMAVKAEPGLNAALDLNSPSTQPARGTLNNTWMPCPLLAYEKDISRLSVQQLEQRVWEACQASSEDPDIILTNLQVRIDPRPC